MDMRQKVTRVRQPLSGCKSLMTRRTSRQSASMYYFSSSPQLFTSNRTHLTAQIGRWGLRDAGFNYNIVAVFGSQSTGKSKSLKCQCLEVLSIEGRDRYTVEQAIWYDL